MTTTRPVRLFTFTGLACHSLDLVAPCTNPCAGPAGAAAPNPPRALGPAHLRRTLLRPMPCASRELQGRVDHLPNERSDDLGTKDKHKNAFAVLTNPRAERMGKILGIEVTTHRSCLGCHSVTGRSPGSDRRLLAAAKPPIRAQQFDPGGTA